MKRNDLWMLTSTGKHFNLRFPNAKDIEIVDICQSLSRTCRYHGHCGPFYSVADHILNGRDHVDAEMRKWWDLHDAEEAYLGDIPTPLKKLLGPAYELIRQPVHKAICERFDLPLDFDSKVKENDQRLLLAEREALFDDEYLTEPWDIDYYLAEQNKEIKYKHVDVKIRPIYKGYKQLYNILKEYE